MAIDFQFQALANSDNTLVAGKVIAVASLGLFAGSALSFSAVIMPSLRKFSSASSLAIWTEAHNSSKCKPSSFPLFTRSLSMLLLHAI
jgi:hypothetical protein